MRRGLPATGPRSAICALLLAAGTACLSDPSGPFGHRLNIAPQALAFAALGDTVRLTVIELGPGDQPLPTPPVEYASAAAAVATVDSTGVVTSRGNGVTWIVARVPTGESDSIPVTVLQLPSGVVASHDTIRFEALGAVQPLGVNVIDRLGTAISGLPMDYAVADSTIATVAPDGRVHARGNGLTAVRVRSAGESLQVIVHVQQRPVRVLTDADSLHFEALGDLGVVAAVAVDSLGHPVLGGGVVGLSVDDTTVLEVVDSETVRARGNGQTVLRFTTGGLAVQQTAVVSQVPDAIVATILDTSPILSVAMDGVVPLSCQANDRNGYQVAIPVTVDPSPAGRWVGSTCDSLRLQRSGIDTVILHAGPLTGHVPLALAIRPVVSAVLGDYLDVDSLPGTVFPWAPTLWRSPSGDWQLFFAGYEPDGSSLSGFRAHLHRLVSNDGQHFRYDGIVLQHDDSDCAPNGSGIENVAIVPRSDAAGWRMYYASGSFTCYGWQVFSAISSDAQTWTKEPGIRLDNGGFGNPGPGAPPWPVGEGMVVEQLATGEWRMLVGGYRRDQPPEDKFHVVEWRSTDQLQWTYVGPVLTTDQLPAAGQRSAYSPTIREFAPGLWRMLFTADDLNVAGGRSRIWSAVSTNQTQWHLEGELLGEVGTDLFYATLVDDRLVYVRKEAAQNQRLATATVTMP